MSVSVHYNSPIYGQDNSIKIVNHMATLEENSRHHQWKYNVIIIWEPPFLPLSLRLFPLSISQLITTLRLAIHTCMHIYQGRPEGPRKLGPATWAGHWSFWLSVVWEKRGRERDRWVICIHVYVGGRGENNMSVCTFVVLRFICRVWAKNHLVQMSSCTAKAGHCTF